MTNAPLLSVVIPTFSNADVLATCLAAWERYAGEQAVQVIVVEDGCRDHTRQLLEERLRSPWTPVDCAFERLYRTLLMLHQSGFSGPFMRQHKS